MNLTRITYLGRKTYREKISNNTWEQGDTKLVTTDAAKRLLRFAEFESAKQEAERAQAHVGKKDEGEQKPTDPELEAAMLRQQEAERAQAQERQQVESMLLTVESMDKPALEEYARKYEVELDKRLGVAKLRAEVSTLIEQFGVR
ncbi:hypothetical protein [Alicycliphilus denitrificans]|uniref:hypothetical protein n=1 Tax=Alicycliphilus denitrificans TaxID=179636 RepID=UPI0003061A0B|nr:hypothetical protein [Alicycliphilus denitrificans]